MKEKLSKIAVEHWAIIAITVIFLILGTIYNLTTPIFEAPDETSHYRYIQYLADGNGLPPLQVADNDVEQGEMHHPPLYYWLNSLLIRSIDTGDINDAYQTNPYAVLGDASTLANKNAIIHSADESWPYEGVTLAVHRIRAFSTLLFAITVVLTYLIALQVMPHRKVAAVGAAALVAFNPQFIFIGASISNDTLATMLAAVSLYLALRVCCGKGHTYRTPIIMGIVVGLAALTKVNAATVALLVPAGYLGFYVAKPQHRSWPDLFRPVLIAAITAIAVGGWWYIRNSILYGDPTGMGVMKEVFGVQAENISLITTLRYMAESITSYWGVFGWLNVKADEAYYVFVRVFSIMGFAGLLLAGVWLTWRKQNMQERNWRGALLVGFWVLVMLLAVGYFTMTITRQQGRHLFPAAPGIALLLLIGVLAWVPRRYENMTVGVIALIFLGVSIITPIRYIAPSYETPTIVTLDEVPEDINPLNVSFGEGMFLLGYDIPQTTVTAGNVLPIRLYWVCTDLIDKDLTISIKAFGLDDQELGTLDTFPGGGNYVTSQWVPGQVIYDDYFLLIDKDLELPTAAPIRVGVYDRETMESVEVIDSRGKNLGNSVQIARARLLPIEEPPVEAQYLADANFADLIALDGYDFTSVPIDGQWELTLHWRALAALDQDYTVFVHVLDQSEELIAQLDEQPLQASYPTSFWEQGENVLDTHYISVPEDFMDDYYTVRVGLYLVDTGERLVIAEDSLTYTDLGPLLLNKE